MDQLALLFPILVTVLHLSVSGVNSSTTFMLLNKCNYTVWPGSISIEVPQLQTTGFALPTGASVTITAPSPWSGNFWGRTLCSHDSAGKFSCATGDCGTGKVECSGASGSPPTTLAEFTLASYGGIDFYDVSLVDGYNLPIQVLPKGGSGDCPRSECARDINGACLSELQVRDENGSVVGCKSACVAFGLPQYCCTGNHNTADTCNPTSYSEMFKRACPSAYSYAYDDLKSSFTCASASYTVIFCPSNENRVVITHPIVTIIISLLLLLLLSNLPQPLSKPPPGSNYSSICTTTSYKCGEQPNLYYPFWGDGQRPSFCGGGDQFILTCEFDQNTSIQMGSQIFEVQDINTTAYTMRMVPLPPPEAPDVCSREFNFSLSPLFRYNQTMHNITIFSDCPSGVPLIGGNNFTCNGTHVVYYAGGEDEVLRQHPGLEKCRRHIQVPAEAVHQPSGRDGGVGGALKLAFGKGFNVSYTLSQECTRCQRSEGACGRNDTHQFTCYCPNGSNHLDCSGYAPVPALPHESNRRHWKKQVIIGVTGAVIAGLLTICCFVCKLSGWQEKSWLPTKSNQDIETFLKTHGAVTLKRYKFSDVKKMTNSFKIKLGQGGFGAVYKGNLPDGSNVAVKILNRSKGNGEDFINEIASINRTSHVNIVTLLGFCMEGRKKVLIYEFMSNGSLDKFIGKKGRENTLSLSWDNLYQIAIGIARGLEYLHRGCNTRILHFDIKPDNILLDENFCPKIADFGLAKLCLRKESIISMSDARGTIGYWAPEVWNRNFGGVSHKSDVYSYGMMLLEIVGGWKNINAEASHSSEIYFPDWIYKRLEQGTGRGFDEEVAIADNEVTKRMTMVGLWCIQTIPNDRPTMSRVVEMLGGSMNSLEMPPKPVLSSPARSVIESSSTTVN